MAAEREELFCTYGEHKWYRPAGLRGRKPLVCDQHKAEAAEAAAEAEAKHKALGEVLHCKEGHDWRRKNVTRGRKPEYCPEHDPKRQGEESTPRPAPQPQAADDLQHLHCELGNHDWTRPKQRGKRPRNCAEHQPVGTTVSSDAVSADTILGQFYVDPESVYVLRYIDQEVHSGLRTAADVSHLQETFTQRANYVRRTCAAR